MNRHVTPPAIACTVNGHQVELKSAPHERLSVVLRGELGLTGTKVGCDAGDCGACTVLMNGHPVKSCLTSVSQAEGYDVVTIEGLAEDALHPVQQAWIDEDVPQCGYCQSGQILSAAALLSEIANPTDQEIDQWMTNICRCGTYARMKKAIRKVAVERGSS